jgi:hypothetical protein
MNCAIHQPVNWVPDWSERLPCCGSFWLLLCLLLPLVESPLSLGAE